MLGVDHAESAMPQRNPATLSSSFYLHFQVIDGRVRHEHGAAQLQQSWSLDDLHESPEVPNPVPPIPVPPPAWLRLQQQLQRFVLEVGVAFSQPVQNRREGLLRRSFDVYMCSMSRVKSSNVMAVGSFVLP